MFQVDVFCVVMLYSVLRLPSGCVLSSIN